MGRELFSLLTYIGYYPEWVRCTIWRDAMPREKPFLPQGLLGEKPGPGFTQVGQQLRVLAHCAACCVLCAVLAV
jgi:hypothetical protein